MCVITFIVPVMHGQLLPVPFAAEAILPVTLDQAHSDSIFYP